MIISGVITCFSHLHCNMFYSSFSGRSSPSETKSEKSSMTQMTGMSVATGPISLGGHHQAPGKIKTAPESFMSLQMEKVCVCGEGGLQVMGGRGWCWPFRKEWEVSVLHKCRGQSLHWVRGERKIKTFSKLTCVLVPY